MKATIAVLDKKEGKTILSENSNKQFKPLKKPSVFLRGRIYTQSPSSSDTEIFAKQLEKGDPFKAAKLFLEKAEGSFAFILAESERIIAGRDTVGIQPLYFGENDEVAAFATNRKALWTLDIHETRSFPPGHLGFISREGFQFQPVKILLYSQPKLMTMQEAAQMLEKLLTLSVRRCVSGSKDIAVAFSGGLDSSIVAFLAKKCHVKVHLVHVSLENQSETEEAKKAAQALDLPLQVYLFREEEVERIVSTVVELIEEYDPIKASIGVPFYWVAEKTAELGFKALLAGQGADELFGGYHRYVNEYLLHGGEKTQKIMFDDIVDIHKSNIERDMKICSFHNVDLRLPFGSYRIANFAKDLPVELKLERRADTCRKLVLRKVARQIGLPSMIVEKPKKALQYSTGVNNALKKIAKKHKKTLAEYIKDIFLSQISN